MFGIGQKVKLRKTDLNLFFEIAGKTGRIINRSGERTGSRSMQYAVKLDNKDDNDDVWWLYEHEIEEVK